MKKHKSQMLEKLEKNIPLLFKKLKFSFSLRDALILNQKIKNKERFLTAAVRKNGKDFILKIRLQDSQEVVKDLKRELKILRFLKKKLPNKTAVPATILSGQYQNLQWYLRERQAGKLSGKISSDFGFRKEFFNKVSPFEIIKILNNYQVFDAKKIRGLRLYRHGGWWYQQDFNFYKENFLKSFIINNLLSENEINIINELLSENKKILDEEAKYFCHGDLYPDNILVADKNKVYFLDWGISNLNNLSFDVAFIYLDAWRNEKWKEKFLKLYTEKQKDKNKFKKLFRISLISLSIRFTVHCWRYLENKKIGNSQKNNIIPVFKKNLEILKAALHNYRPII